MASSREETLIGVGSYALRYAIGAPGFTPAQPLTPHRLLDKAQALGADVVQILDNMPLDNLSQSELASLRRHADDLGVQIELGMRGSRPDDLRRNLTVAESLGAGILRTVLTDVGWEPSVDQVSEILIALLPALRTAGVTLAIENRFHFLPTQVAEIIRSINDPRIRACLDIMNSITRLVGPGEAVAALAPYAVSVHIKDAQVVREGTGFRVYGCRLGEGAVDLGGIIAQIQAVAPVRSALVEGWMDPLGTHEETLAQEEAWVRDGIRDLRRIWQETRRSR